MQGSRILEMNYFQDATWHGLGDIKCIGCLGQNKI